MRWKAEPRLERNLKRVVRPFAWWPTIMSDGHTTVWLEHYELREVCEPVDVDGRLGWVGYEALPLGAKK